jgi:hypothetical protein
MRRRIATPVSGFLSEGASEKPMSIKKVHGKLRKKTFALVRVVPFMANAVRRRNAGGSPTRKGRSIGVFK